MSWLSLKGKIDWKIEREKQYFHIIKNFQYFVMPYTSNSLPHYCAEKKRNFEAISFRHYFVQTQFQNKMVIRRIPYKLSFWKDSSFPFLDTFKDFW